ncbi:hypothetical protein EYC80_003457 [Monilinia laxa]|uniref:Uncharacterized protein n=1 Tax=Monilinia laxa TaxID=61186 RepID=A0A5N6KDV2_MONLA|nr:hypothetical protein EYC80_003457 [Monilinia laxa]
MRYSQGSGPGPRWAIGTRQLVTIVTSARVGVTILSWFRSWVSQHIVAATGFTAPQIIWPLEIPEPNTENLNPTSPTSPTLPTGRNLFRMWNLGDTKAKFSRTLLVTFASSYILPAVFSRFTLDLSFDSCIP